MNVLRTDLDRLPGDRNSFHDHLQDDRRSRNHVRHGIDSNFLL